MVEELFPPIEPYKTGRLKVSDIHELYYEECGNPKGNPVIYLHGGPGSGCSSSDRQFFDPAVYHIILLDQRGAGRSTPHAELEQNTTWDLVEDLEKLRRHVEVDKWMVFGGSWGSFLAMAYSETHPERVKALIIRGIFVECTHQIRWLYKYGAPQVYPDHWQQFVNLIPPEERGSLMHAYHRRLTSRDEEVRVKFAKAWNKWEIATGRILLDEEGLQRAENDKNWSLCHARTECHYFIHGMFLESNSWIYDNVDKIRHIPGTIIQGRYDMSCPPEAAWALHQKWPEAEFHMIPLAGHSPKDPGVCEAIVKATEKYKHL